MLRYYYIFVVHAKLIQLHDLAIGGHHDYQIENRITMEQIALTQIQPDHTIDENQRFIM